MYGVYKDFIDNIFFKKENFHQGEEENKTDNFSHCSDGNTQYGTPEESVNEIDNETNDDVVHEIGGETNGDVIHEIGDETNGDVIHEITGKIIDDIIDEVIIELIEEVIASETNSESNSLTCSKIIDRKGSDNTESNLSIKAIYEKSIGNLNNSPIKKKSGVLRKIKKCIIM